MSELKSQIIEVKQLPIIEQRLQLVKAAVIEQTEAAMKLVCTEDTLQSVKKTRTSLKKDFTEWEEKRKAVKKAVMSPYEQFETVYKECVSDIYNNAYKELTKKIDDVETELKEQKAAEVKAYFDEYVASKEIEETYGKFFTFEQTGIKVTLSASKKSLKEQAANFVDRICDDLNLIETQEHKDEILYHYRKIDGSCYLNVSRAIQLVNEKYKAIEAEKAREAERKARAEAAKATERKADEAVKPAKAIEPPKVEEPILTVKFTVKGTKAKLQELKAYLERNGFDYE